LLENSLRPLTPLGIPSASRVTPFPLTPSVLLLIQAGPATEKGAIIALHRVAITKNSVGSRLALFNCNGGKPTNANSGLARSLKTSKRAMKRND
ncbi:MAG: hypothetical protein ABL921_32955, partial [Pirellula sp.]